MACSQIILPLFSKTHSFVLCPRVKMINTIVTIAFCLRLRLHILYNINWLYGTLLPNCFLYKYFSLALETESCFYLFFCMSILTKSLQIFHAYNLMVQQFSYLTRKRKARNARLKIHLILHYNRTFLIISMKCILASFAACMSMFNT